MKTIKEIVKKYGLTDKQLQERESVSKIELGEMGVNLGYIWLHKFKKWVYKSNLTNAEMKLIFDNN